MKFKDYIIDSQQTNLDFQKLTEREKLKEYRNYLYKDLTKKLNLLDKRKVELVKEYRDNVKEIDIKINSIGLQS
jgi:hypothetical protein